MSESEKDCGRRGSVPFLLRRGAPMNVPKSCLEVPEDSLFDTAEGALL